MFHKNHLVEYLSTNLPDSIIVEPYDSCVRLSDRNKSKIISVSTSALGCNSEKGLDTISDANILEIVTPYCITNSYSWNKEMLLIPRANRDLSKILNLFGHRAPTNPRYRIVLSHDVDRPFLWSHSKFRQKISHFIKVLSEFGIVSTISTLKNWLNKINDPYDTYCIFMTLAEKFGVVSQFNFFAGNPHGINPDYRIMEPKILDLMRRIKDRGHLIGFHGSIESSTDPQALKREADMFMSACARIGYEKPMLTGRQHYLTFDLEKTPSILASAGIAIDSSIGWSDKIGFRAGTANPFPLFDPVTEKFTSVIEEPLLIMDRAIIRLLNNGHSLAEVLGDVKTIRDNVIKYGGNFTILWHNDVLGHPRYGVRLFAAVAGIDA